MDSCESAFPETGRSSGPHRRSEIRFIRGPVAFILGSNLVPRARSENEIDLGAPATTTSNVTRKYNFFSFVLLRDYFNSLTFYKNGGLSRNQIGRGRVQKNYRK